MEKKKLTVAMSGGIDSAVAALLAIRAGYDVSGATMRLCKKLDEHGNDMSEQDITDARAVCDRIGITHRVYSLEENFHKTVVRDFIDTYISAGTPNPCIVCNKFLKFGILLDQAISDGADLIATGHYARIERSLDGRFLLKKAADGKRISR